MLSVFVSVLVVYQLERESAEQHDEGPAAVAGVTEHCDSTLQLSANTVRFTSVCCRWYSVAILRNFHSRAVEHQLLMLFHTKNCSLDYSRTNWWYCPVVVTVFLLWTNSSN